MKNKNLYAYHLEIQGWRGSVMFHFQASRIKNFYDKNAVRLNILLEKLDKLQQKYFVISPNNELVMQVEDPNTPVLLEGMLKEDYDKEYAELMERDIQIIF